MAQDLLTIILASVSCVAFCLVILMLAVVLYRKDPLCCRFRPHRTQDYIEDLPHFHSRPSLIGITHTTHGTTLNQSATAPQLPGGLFVIGKPTDYHLGGPLPRLPSYESVRKKDRQRHIHAMIAQRFGIDDVLDEPPPTYEETFRHSLSSAHIQPLDVHMSLHTHGDHLDLSEDEQNPSPPSTAQQEPAPTSPRPLDFGLLSL